MGRVNRLTERQLQRRSKILATTRELLEEHGYNGVKMRDLADRAGVATQTLYHIFGGKDELLARAIEERNRFVYESHGRGVDEVGVERLFVFAERECRIAMSSPVLTRSVAPIFSARPGAFLTGDIYMRHHRQAVHQIKDAGELVDWADTDFLVRYMLLQAHGILVSWANGDVSTENFEDFIKLNICNTLAPVTTGETREIIAATVERIHPRLRDWYFRKGPLP